MGLIKEIIQDRKKYKAEKKEQKLNQIKTMIKSNIFYTEQIIKKANEMAKNKDKITNKEIWAMDEELQDMDSVLEYLIKISKKKLLFVEHNDLLSTRNDLEDAMISLFFDKLDMSDF